MDVGQRPQRQRFTQRQNVSCLVQQPAHQRRADVARVKDEMDGPPVHDAARGVGDTGDGQPRALCGRTQDAIVEEARGVIGTEVEPDEQNHLSVEVNLLRIGVGRCGQLRQQVAGNRLLLFRCFQKDHLQSGLDRCRRREPVRLPPEI